MPDSLSATIEKLGDSKVPAKLVNDFSSGAERVHSDQDIPSYLEKQHPKDLVGQKSWKLARYAAMADDQESNEAVAERLRLLRTMLEGDDQGSQTRFARRVKLEVKRWNNFERGSPLSKDAAFKIVRAFPNVTLDWVYRGRTEGLPVRLQREIEEAGKATTAAPIARSKTA